MQDATPAPAPKPEERFRQDAFSKRERTYNQDGLITMHNTGFMDEPRFANAYATTRQHDPWSGADIQWRVHVLCWSADIASRLEGDFVECGVNRGGTALAVVTYLDFASLPRQFYLLDTFAGLDPNVSTEDEVERFAGVYSDCYEATSQLFAGFQNVQLVKGTIPDTLAEIRSEQIAWLHVDLNSADPEIATMEALWPKLVSGGVVVFDDYGWVACSDQKEALDKFAAQRGFAILTLPTGQGMAIKR